MSEERPATVAPPVAPEVPELHLPDAPPVGGRRLSRRTVLTAGALGLVAAGGTYAAARSGLVELPEVPGLPALSGPTPPELRIDPQPVDFRELEARRRIGSAAYTYEITGQPATYYVTTAFGQRLDQWLSLHRQHIGQVPDEIRSFGAWVRGSATSWHSSGEAIDIARLRADGRDLTSLRYDEWRDAPSGELSRRLRLYWRTVAGLHHEFADVLTYLFDDEHANHVHVDTGRFGPTERPRLIRRSRAQAQAVQAMCRHVWGRTDVEITGQLDDVTREATSRVLESSGQPGELTDSREAWQAFLVATMREA